MLRERVVEKMTLQEIATARGGVSTKTVQRDLDVALGALDETLREAGVTSSLLR
ncbi:MAG: hypothetical protein U0414_16785 [Polyangiaceae bacterium]